MLPMSLSKFFVLEADNAELMVLQACQVYAVKRAVDIRHRASAISGADAVFSLVWQGHKTAAIQHSDLARRYAQIWSTVVRKRKAQCTECGLELFECDCPEVGI